MAHSLFTIYVDSTLNHRAHVSCGIDQIRVIGLLHFFVFLLQKFEGTTTLDYYMRGAGQGLSSCVAPFRSNSEPSAADQMPELDAMSVPVERALAGCAELSKICVNKCLKDKTVLVTGDALHARR